MSNTNIKIIYSLRMHVALQQQGFVHITEMKNPKNSNLNCWVYAVTPDFSAAFEALSREGNRDD